MEVQELKDENEELKSSLMAAQVKIRDLTAVVNDIMAPPYCVVQIIDVYEQSAREGDPSCFTPGASVRIKEDSPYYGQFPGKVGTIICHYNDKRGWVLVQFGKDANIYRIGLPDVDGGECDLELDESNQKIALAIMDSRKIEVRIPKHLEIEPGDKIKITLSTLIFVDVAPQTEDTGIIADVRDVLDDSRSEINFNGNRIVVSNGKFFGMLEPGDRVVVDQSGTIILDSLGKKNNRFRFFAETNVSWDDIGGQKKVIEDVREIFEDYYESAELNKFYHKKQAKGVIFVGPPGNAKTMMAKAIATSYAKRFDGKGSSSSFFYIKGPELFDKYVGVGEGAIRGVFAAGRKHYKEFGYPAIIFIDECDPVMKKRGTGVSSDVNDSFVAAFLSEMDGLEGDGFIVILSTNRADVIDPAILRDERINRIIAVNRPDFEGAKDIFNIYLRKLPLENGYTAEKLSEISAKVVFSDERAYREIQLNGNGESALFGLRHIVSGAMISGIVDRATAVAIKRDRTSGKKSGLTVEDLIAAIDSVYKENMHVNHNDALVEFLEKSGLDASEIAGIYKPNGKKPKEAWRP